MLLDSLSDEGLEEFLVILKSVGALFGVDHDVEEVHHGDKNVERVPDTYDDLIRRDRQRVIKPHRSMRLRDPDGFIGLRVAQ